MKILSTLPEGVVIAQLSAREANLIGTAVTAPIKRKVLAMSPKLEALANEILEAKKFNDEFIDEFYPYSNGRIPVKKSAKIKVKKVKK